MPETRQDRRPDGLLHLFADPPLTIAAAFENHDDEEDDDHGFERYRPWDQPCERCGEDHGPAECPYGGCDPGEHCRWECPYETGHTDWDRVYPHLPDTMHRGMAVHLPGHNPQAAHHQIAHDILNHLDTHEIGMGTHWSPSEHQGRHYAAVSHHDGSHNLHVVLHAAKPHRDDIEEDPHELLKQDVIGFDQHEDAEIPLQRSVPVQIKGVSWKAPGARQWTRHDFNQPVQHRAVLTRTAGAAERERFAPREGESASWGAGRDRIVHALSMGHLHIEDAGQLGYGRGSGEGMDEDRRDGWQTLPQQLWHTTTDLPQAQHGLKTRAEMSMRHGHGLGGGPENTISLTDSREHAHTMLAGLHEYHDVLTGKTSLSQLEDHARQGHGAQQPYLDYQRSMMGYSEPSLHSVMRGMRHVPDVMTDAEASERGLHPHPTNHHRATIGDMGGGWERPATPEELSHDRSEVFKAHLSGRRFAGGPRPILFMSNDPHALAQKAPNDFAVLRVSPKPGAQGYRIRGEHEWRTGTGEAVHVHGVDQPDADSHPTPGVPHAAGGKPWLPHDRFFGPGHPDLDPRLFDGTHLKPAWRRALLKLVAKAFVGYGPGYIRWTKAYLAGSQASHWYGNDDLDVLIGIDYDAFRRAQPHYRTMRDDQIDDMLNADAHAVCDPARWFTIGGEHLGPWDSTVYVNPDSYDILKIKPYAAYDLNEDRWAVEPMSVPADFGPDKLPGADFLYARSLASQVRALKGLPAGQAQALGAALYDRLHGERHDAFSEHGGGLYDVRNIAWKYLTLHPQKPMEQLLAWKRAESPTKTASAMADAACICCNGAGQHANGRPCRYCGTSGQQDNPAGPAPCAGALADTAPVSLNDRGELTSTCPCGTPATFGLDGGDWWSHADGSIGHDDDDDLPVAERMRQIASPGAQPRPVHTAGLSTMGSDADFNHDSAMIALVPPSDLAQRLVVDKGESADELHITLAYIPHVAPGDIGRLTGTVAEWASRQRPVTARIQGAGTFIADSHVLWAAVDIPGSSHLHSSLIDALKAAGFKPAQDHGFTAHMTLSYNKHHVRFLPKVTPESFTSHAVYVCQGDDWRPVPLGGATA